MMYKKKIESQVIHRHSGTAIHHIILETVPDIVFQKFRRAGTPVTSIFFVINNQVRGYLLDKLSSRYTYEADLSG